MSCRRVKFPAEKKIKIEKQKSLYKQLKYWIEANFKRF